MEFAYDKLVAGYDKLVLDSIEADQVLCLYVDADDDADRKQADRKQKENEISETIQEAHIERALRAIDARKRCITKVKPLHKPLHLIPRSIHPIKFAA